MTDNAKIAFFDGLADKWDGFDNLDVLALRLSAGLDTFGIREDETILDVGCGTGNLTRALLEKLSAKGKIAAVDISPKMISVAKGKISDARVTWHVEDASRLSMKDATFDRIVCFSMWPHFDDKKQAAEALFRVLRPGGALHIWHLISRKEINDIHASAGEAVHADVLPEASSTATLLSACGYLVTCAEESDTGYLVSAQKPETGAA